MAISKADLLAARSKTRVVTLDIGDVEVRGLTRKEALSIEGKEMDAEAVERKLLALAMVNPQMTEDEIGQWQAVSPAAELLPIVDAILELSGMQAEAAKHAMTSFRG